jgi:hypothetical protein
MHCIIKCRVGALALEDASLHVANNDLNPGAQRGKAGMSFNRKFGLMLSAATLLSSASMTIASPLMIVGNDEKVLWDNDGKVQLSPAGKDSVLVVDLANPESPKIVATLPLKNSVVGPPVNLDIDPTGTIALVADSVDVTKDGDTLKQTLDN